MIMIQKILILTQNTQLLACINVIIVVPGMKYFMKRRNKMIRKILGPPGTGKTTKLLKYVKTFLKLGTPINKIGYFAFTTKAANEAVERMLDYHTALEKKDLPYFKTLHAFAFARLGLKKSNVMQPEHYEDIGRSVGIEVTVYTNGEEKTGFVDSDSEYFNI